MSNCEPQGAEQTLKDIACGKYPMTLLLQVQNSSARTQLVIAASSPNGYLN